jgi:hypothetical protein
LIFQQNSSRVFDVFGAAQRGLLRGTYRHNGMADGVTSTAKGGNSLPPR